ncbi:MAG: T9SS type A sorting domain-containing protein [Bacteroidota bacterium]|nr:T9SS type A sorting domain-containing protein [Bacteroidota bacterium]
MESLAKYTLGIRVSRTAYLLAAILLVLFFAGKTYAQQRIAHVQPDALGPGMTIAMEVMAPAKDTGAFGADGMYLPSSKILLRNAADSLRVVFGPVVVSWNGRVLQVPVMAKTGVATGPVTFQILTGNKRSAFAAFEISQPIPKLSISGGATLGDNTFALYSFNGSGNTIVAQEIEFLGRGIQDRGLFTFSKADDNTSIGGNPHYHPVTLLSKGPIHLRFAEISVSADSLNGGPGGGGGGHGFSGTGGAGYTGGGSDSAYSDGNIGSGTNSTTTFGGSSSTGIVGGESSNFNSDQGGGGGTGCPYGSSGTISGGNDSSQFGGFGGASAGGEAPGVVYGGGGGAFASGGEQGAGLGDNSGKTYGGRFLLPMQGGSGGGAGNDANFSADSSAGSGGGGGGALTLVSFDTLSVWNSFVTADGAKGTSGQNFNEAGGGGGSGGGIILSGRNNILFTNANVSAAGGNGGLGGDTISQKSKGGAGGFGRIRFDGDLTNKGAAITGALIGGPTLDLSAKQLAGPLISVTGTAGDSASLTDTMRIYYRNDHSSWRLVETERFQTNGKYRWQTFLPAGHDSSLFVTAMAQVRNPSRSFANFEPEYLLSHLSSGIVRITPTPHLVLLQDTLIFGCFKIGDTCVRAHFYFSNMGEDSIHFSSITISDPNFHIIGAVNNMGYYVTDSIIVEYCPTTVGKDTATLTFNSNDTTRTAIIIGCGIDRDTRIVLKPTTLDFGRVHIGSCDTLKLTARSIGKDSALVSPNGFVHPPFEIIKPLKDSLLAPKDSLQIVISFCPTDTGAFHTAFIMTEKRDSAEVSGIGTRGILLAAPTIVVKPLCIGSCDSVKIPFSSVGNDEVKITGISGAEFTQKLPFKVPPQTDTEFTVHYCARAGGDTSILIQYVSDADSSNETSIQYHGIQPVFVADSAFHFTSLCIPQSDSLHFELRRTGLDTIVIDSIRLVGSSAFSLAGDTSRRVDSSSAIIHFSPAAGGDFAATLIAYLHAGTCSDSVVSIPIDGSAVSSKLSLSTNSINFGTIDTGSCSEDSVTITSSCPAVISMPVAQPPFFRVSPVGNSISLSGGESQTIIYRYCPSSLGDQSASLVFSSSSDGNDSLMMHGSGRAITDSPFIRFKLANSVATAGQEFQYLIEVDSVSAGTNIKYVQGSLHYDPTVIKPIEIKGILWAISNSGEVYPGVYNFAANFADSLRAGPFATLSILPLYGNTDKTTVAFDSIQVIGNARAESLPGSIQVIHCGDLPGHISVAGEYALGNPSPNPAGAELLLPVTLGTDGLLRIRIYSASGMKALERSIDAKRGENTVTINVASLPSGIYYLSADSWGWHEGRTVIIEK